MQEPEAARTFREEQSAYLREAEAIIDTAEEQGVQLRLLGAIAVIKHCPEYIWLHEATNRELTDIDYMAYSKQQKQIRDLLTGMGYAVKGGGGGVTLEVWSGREIYVDPEGARHNVDIFYDKLDFCHPIEFEGRLHLDSPTIPLSDLFLEKLQIVEINEKDLKDLMIMLLEHPISTGGDPGTEQIDAVYIGDRLSKDWGFYYTTNMNLDRVLSFLPRYEAFAPEHRQTIEERIAELRRHVEEQPKSIKWKMRAKVGTKQKWYRDVAEEYREIGR